MRFASGKSIRFPWESLSPYLNQTFDLVNRKDKQNIVITSLRSQNIFTHRITTPSEIKLNRFNDFYNLIVILNKYLNQLNIIHHTYNTCQYNMIY